MWSHQAWGSVRARAYWANRSHAPSWRCRQRRRAAYAAHVLRMKHLVRLVGSFGTYAVVNRVWWIIPLMLILGLFGLFIAAGQAAAPYTIYTLF
jgi:hypothetical protein